MVDMPSGAVTFLFTDIERSTRLVKQLRDRYGAVLADHQRLLRSAFVDHGGYEVDTQGDSFFVAFASARDALLAAVEGQLALASHSWPDGVEIRVRMGLHTGQAVASNGRYTGLAVHRAARIGGAGHGGQILVSQATQTLLEDEEEDLHVTLQDLGEQSLKDLDRPVRLYQAAAEGLRASFPPIRGDGDVESGAGSSAATPLWHRKRLAVIVGAVALAGVVAVAAALLLRDDSSGGLGAITANHVGLIDPASNHIVAEIPVGIRPGPVAAGEGFIWVGNLDDRTLTKIDATRREATATVSLDNRTPSGIAAGLGGVWVAHGLSGELARVDPQFGQVTLSIPVGDTAFGSPNGSVALDSTSVWVVFGDSTLAHVDADGTVLGKTLAGPQPAGIVTAAGSVWVTSSGDATVQRYNDATFTQGPLRTFDVGTQPTGIAFGDAAIWVANTGDGAVTRIDTSSGASRSIAVGAGAAAVAEGSGSIWVANTAAGTVSRIDPATNDVVATIATGNVPSGIVVAGGYVWVTAQAP